MSPKNLSPSIVYAARKSRHPTGNGPIFAMMGNKFPLLGFSFTNFTPKLSI
jgi:hypothetical protein